MSILEQIELWFSTTGAKYADQEVRELLNDAAAEIERLQALLDLSEEYNEQKDEQIALLKSEYDQLKVMFQTRTIVARHLNDVRLGKTNSGLDKWYKSQYPWLEEE